MQHMSKPKSIECVNFLLGISIIINVVFGVVNLSMDMQSSESFSVRFIIIFIIAILVKSFWYFKIYKGSQIAKNLFIWIGCIAWPVIFLFSFYIMYDKSFFDGLEHLIISAIGVVVVLLLMKADSKQWFE